MAGEKLFESKVKRFLREYPEQIWFTKIWGGGYQKAGIPDLICCVNGVFVSVELKASNGVSSDLQKRNTKLINKTGGIGIILYPEGFDSFKKLILEVMECNLATAELNASKAAHTGTKCNILTG